MITVFHLQVEIWPTSWRSKKRLCRNKLSCCSVKLSGCICGPVSVWNVLDAQTTTFGIIPGMPGNEFLEDHPDWAPSLHLGRGHPAVRERPAQRAGGWGCRQGAATPASQDATGNMKKVTIKAHTGVYSRYLKPEDIQQPASEAEKQELTSEAAPLLLAWDIYPLPHLAPVVEESGGEAQAPDGVPVDALKEHDYATDPDGALVDQVLEENHTNREKIRQQRRMVEGLSLWQRFGIYRFAASDEDIRFFTRFASYDLLMGFWALIEPFLPSTVGVHRRIGPLIDSTPSTRSLQPIDELFLFLNFLALGSKPMDLAERFRVHQSKVSRIIKAWSNFLFTVLGSMRIWVHGDQIQQNLPADFQQYPDTTVILGCTELSCQFSSRLLQKEAISSCKSHWTLKGLVGMAPHGAVTFVSPLYAVDNSDEHIAHESGLIDLLTPGMEVMVHRGVLIGDILPCKVVRPAFRRSQTSAGEVRETQASARLRAHVGRLFSRVKEHKLLDSDIPPGVFGIINQLYTVACLLINYENGPTVKA
uniref:DDE Tnp4 domain-containing protein n=2 Tax=Fundulus heteroclitus TaxID=8078 RepID=A0A3Q2QVI4_FUNHE